MRNSLQPPPCKRPLRDDDLISFQGDMALGNPWRFIDGDLVTLSINVVSVKTRKHACGYVMDIISVDQR